MDPESVDSAEFNARLAQFSTVWTTVLQAHGGPLVAEAEAQQRFMERYHGAVYRFLLTALRDAEAANELFQEFALRFVRGDFRNFDPTRGRFRNYLKTALINLIRDYRKRQASRRETLVAEGLEPVAPDQEPDQTDAEFEMSWREELIARTWTALAEDERSCGQPHCAVLKFRVEHPDVKSSRMASELTRLLKPDRPFTETGIRKTLQRAREKFANLLLDEVACSLGQPALEELEGELIDLQLHDYCRTALDQRWILAGDTDQIGTPD